MFIEEGIKCAAVAEVAGMGRASINAIGQYNSRVRTYTKEA